MSLPSNRRQASGQYCSHSISPRLGASAVVLMLGKSPIPSGFPPRPIGGIMGDARTEDHLGPNARVRRPRAAGLLRRLQMQPPENDGAGRGRQMAG
jgi:hypothetical protein